MPEHLRALVVILVLASIIFAISKRPAYEIVHQSDFIRRRNIWFAITLAAFLAHSFWVYILISGCILVFARTREPNPSALFLFLLFIIPSTGAKIPGLGLVNYLFSISHPRLLVLLILLPAYFYLSRSKQATPFGRLLPDKFLFSTSFWLFCSIYVRLRSLIPYDRGFTRLPMFSYLIMYLAGHAKTRAIFVKLFFSFS